ncbi:MAG: 1,4-alpha-glucan branching protein GlgB [Gammaproteobacteria bacterium]|jgi:1,4-alpha-glucan branching enzyme
MAANQLIETETSPAAALGEEAVRRLLEARLHDPFQVLGSHPANTGARLIRAFLPDTRRVDLVEAGDPMQRIGKSDLWQWSGDAASVPQHYRLRRVAGNGSETEFLDPYSFPAKLDERDLGAFADGGHSRAHRFLGSHCIDIDGVTGVRFAVWAPNAERVSVVGNFNDWDGRRHPMRVAGHSGVWVLFIPELAADELYKYEIRNRNDGAIQIKTDPFARQFEHRPSTASVTVAEQGFDWGDGEWVEARSNRDWLHAPMSIYELHLGSWRRHQDGRFMSYREIAAPLTDHVRELGFTHVELMPITEHPLDESWGYQSTGYFAPTRRYGSPDDFRYLVDYLHRNGIGVLLDWVPGHFPRDEHGLARFDGTPLFEYEDARKGAHAEWGTLVFNYDRSEVRSFLISSAIFWLEDMHLDGLRIDAVASMLYLDYARTEGEWLPNVYGGREHLEAVSFLRQLNEVTHGLCPGTVTIAEESTAWPAVTRPTVSGGLGFSMKWNMGWMHDSLVYLSKDPVHRRFHHDLLTFGPIYAFTENFVLPFSHDEVVHMKGSLLQKMPGDDWQRFANLRLALSYQWTYPGKKLLFMGQEFGQPWEWNHRESLPWHLLDYPAHAGIRRLIADLNRLYVELPALHELDFEYSGFQWLCWTDAENSVLSYLRRGRDEEVVVVLNFTPVPRSGYRIGVPRGGRYREVFNSDSRFYGGTDVGNPIPLEVQGSAAMGQPHSIELQLPPLGCIILTRAV